MDGRKDTENQEKQAEETSKISKIFSKNRGFPLDFFSGDAYNVPVVCAGMKW